MKALIRQAGLGMASGVLAVGCAATPHDPCPAVRTVTVVNTPGELRVSHECITVRAGEEFVLQLRPPREAGKARTRPDPEKNSKEKWLDESSDNAGRIRIRAPMSAASCPDDGCKYEIVVDGIGTLDPRVRVR